MVLAGILDRTSSSIAVISTTCFVSAHGAQSALYSVHSLMEKHSVQSREQRRVMLFNTTNT